MVDLRLGDCREILPTLADASVDCVITDPPYPEISRPYGRLTEAQWHDLMDVVVPECRRILKPTGSAVFILQPNSERVGRMRLWLWKFMVKWGEAWGIVQDAYWWNYAMLPNGGAPNKGMLRASVKAAVWLGPAECYRDQESVLWSESDESRRRRLAGRAGIPSLPSGNQADYRRIDAAAARRGGTTPFNLLPFPGVDEEQSKGGRRHPAMTPESVADWWLRYICPPGGTMLDPFCGVGTMPLAALKQDKRPIGIDKEASYIDTARARIAAELAKAPLLNPVA